MEWLEDTSEQVNNKCGTDSLIWTSLMDAWQWNPARIEEDWSCGSCLQCCLPTAHEPVCCEVPVLVAIGAVPDPCNQHKSIPRSTGSDGICVSGARACGSVFELILEADSYPVSLKGKELLYQAVLLLLHAALRKYCRCATVLLDRLLPLLAKKLDDSFTALKEGVSIPPHAVLTWQYTMCTLRT